MNDPTYLRQSLVNDIWHVCDILRRDNNCGGVMQYVEHLVRLRFLDAQEEEWARRCARRSAPSSPI